MKSIKSLSMSGAEVLPLVEGGKGIAVSTGISAGYWAKAGGVGTISAVNADSYDENGKLIPQIYKSKNRRERQIELIKYGIAGGIAQAKIAHDIAGGQGRIHVNFLWEMGGAEELIKGILKGAPGLIHGLTCGAGMPYRLAEIAAEANVFYYPIVSSARAFNVLWKRSYHKAPELLGGVVYEDPWRAGGHNGLSNAESPLEPQEPFPRVRDLRTAMNKVGLQNTPIIMAGGVWHLNEWEDWLDNPEIGPIAFQFGTRPLLTKESTIPDAWKDKMRTLKKGDVKLNRFSPTGFYSSAVNNSFLQNLKDRSDRQIAYVAEMDDHFIKALPIGGRGREVFVSNEDFARAQQWGKEGFDVAMRTPDHTLVFVGAEESRQILNDQNACMGCLSACNFSNWSQQGPEYNTGKRPDPRSLCIQKNLQNMTHIPEGTSKEEADKIIDHNLMFAGTNVWRFGTDPFYKDGFTPTVKELVDRIMTGK